MNEFLALLKAIPMKLLNLLNLFIDGLAKQISTSKGFLILLVALIIFFDVVTKGSLGVIVFVIGQIQAFLEVVFSSVKDTDKGTVYAICVVFIVWILTSKNRSV